MFSFFINTHFDVDARVYVELAHIRGNSYHSILFACLLGLVKTSASREEQQKKNRRQTHVRQQRHVLMCSHAHRELFRGRLLWMLKGCPQVNKPTSVLLCTSSIAAGARSRFTAQPPKLTTVN